MPTTTAGGLPIPQDTDPVADGAQSIRDLANALDSTTGWNAVTFTNGWVNFGGTYQVCQYRRVGSTINVRGVMKSGTVNTPAFTLPAGFRPPADLLLSTSAVGFGALTVSSAGVVTLASGSNAAASVCFYFQV